MSELNSEIEECILELDNEDNLKNFIIKILELEKKLDDSGQKKYSDDYKKLITKFYS